MQLFGLDIDQIVDLGTRVAQTGAMRSMEVVADGIFDYAIGIAILIYEQDPDGEAW